EHRYWDGATWTDHVSSHGAQSSDAATGQGHVPTVQRATDKVVRDVAKAGATPAHVGGGTLFTEPVLVVNQKAKLIEVNSEYAVYDQNGNQIGAVRQVGQSALKKVVRVIGDIDQFLTHSFQVVDASGSVVLTLTRPRKLMKSRVVVGDSGGNEIGQVRQLNAIGKIRFGLEVGGEQIGTINGENWRAWNWNIQDASGTEIARITKTWEGLAKTLFTTADNYVLQIHRPLEDPLRSMVVASALAVDTALKQDSRGFS
ncbi:MAG: phospholipid scramblase-related protein, partial [Acidimicrobiales bacterium]|nr:phospholipid scramblase-related protein [Acidimicrobiales bacterium]